MTRFRSLRGQLGLILLAFLLLVVGSGAATYAAIRAQQHDALVINLAGRERMLSQQMLWMALSQPESPALSEAVARFDQSLQALRFGGQALDAQGDPVTVPPAPSAQIRAQLDEVDAIWQRFQTQLSPASRINLEQEAARLLAQLDVVVTSYETAARAKLFRLELIQGSFLAAALILLAWGTWVTRQRIIQPLEQLGATAERIGSGDLDAPVPRLSLDELDELAASFDGMRQEVAAARRRLEEQVAFRTRELETAFEFSQEIVAQQELDQLLQSVTDRARLLVEARQATLCLLEPDQDQLKLSATSFDRASGAPRQASSIGTLIASGPFGSNGENLDSACARCSFRLDPAAGTCVSVPIQTGVMQLGTLCVTPQTEADLSAEGHRALALLANAAAVAISNHRLIEAGHRQTETTARLEERQQLAAALHDDLAQRLSFLRLKLEQVGDLAAAGEPGLAHETLVEMGSEIEAAYQQLRAALIGLREAPPDPSDLRGRIEAQLKEFSDLFQIPVTFEVEDETALILHPVVQNQAMHILREALNNARRHAQASHITLTVDCVDQLSRMVFQDNGCGFDPELPRDPSHLGLEIMHQRAARSGGHLTVESHPGDGTRVTACFPLATPEGLRAI